MKILTNVTTLVFALLFLSGANPQPETLRLGVGVNVSIPVYMDYTKVNENVTAARLVAIWDTIHFEYVDVTAAPQWSENGYFSVENERNVENGEYLVAHAGIQPLNGDSLMFTITLQTKDILDSGSFLTEGRFNEVDTTLLFEQPYMIDKALPVELEWFFAVVNDSDVKFNWQTASERNAALFEIYAVPLTWERRWVRKPAFKLYSGSAQGTDVDGHKYSALVRDVPPGYYAFELKQIDFDGTFHIYQSERYEVGMERPSMSLYPNPANPTLTVTVIGANYQLTSLDMYDLLGRHVRQIANEHMIGQKNIIVELEEMPSGIYFVVMRREGAILSQQFTLIK